MRLTRVNRQRKLEVPVHDAEEAVQLALRWNPQVQEAMATVEKARAGTDQQIGASFDRFVRAIAAVLILASSSEVHF